MMPRSRTLKNAACLTILSLACAAGAACASTQQDNKNASASTLEPVLRQDVNEATEIAESLEDGLESYLKAVFIDAAREDIEKSSEDHMLSIFGESPVTADATDSLLRYAKTFADEALAIGEDPRTAIRVSKVSVEQVSEVAVARVDSKTISATVDLKISRHIAEDDVDWVETIPHEILIEDGAVVELVPHNLEHSE